MRIRPAHRSDIPALVSVACAAFIHEPVYDQFSPFRFDYPNDYRTFWLNVWRGKLASANNTVIVAQIDESDEEEAENRGEVVGFSDWYRSGSAEELSRWNTDSWSKRMGAMAFLTCAIRIISSMCRTGLERPLLKIQERYNSFFSFDRTTCEAAIDKLHSQGAVWDAKFPSLIHLNILGVSPDHQRKGIGRRLVEYGMQRAKEEGVRVLLEATASGMPLYIHQGFVEIGRSVLPAREERGLRISELELPIMVWDPDGAWLVVRILLSSSVNLIQFPSWPSTYHMGDAAFELTVVRRTLVGLL